MCVDQNCTCTNHGAYISYQDDMVATQLVAGLYNTEHQAKVLFESSDLQDLDKKFKRLLVLEKSDASLSTLSSGGDAYSHMVAGFTTKRRGGGGGKKSDRKSAWKEKDKSGKPLPGKPSTLNDSTCVECKGKHPQCCGGYHKCTTKCNSCQGLGHIRNCCPTAAVAANTSLDILNEEQVAFAHQISVVNIPLDMHIPSDTIVDKVLVQQAMT